MVDLAIAVWIFVAVVTARISSAARSARVESILARSKIWTPGLTRLLDSNGSEGGLG